MRVYLDNCCYNRLLDDRSYSKIYYERNSVMPILELAENGELMYGLCKDEIQVNDAILDRAEKIRHSSNIKYKDSIHLACAEVAGAEVLVTTDEKFMKNANRIKTFTRVLNPGQWLLEMLYQ